MTLPSFIKSKLALLDRPDFPRNGICHHLGVSYSFNGNTIGFADWNDDALLIMVYMDASRFVRSASGEIEEMGRSKTDHDQIIADVAKGAESNVLQTWNGEEDNQGVSIVLSRKCPEGLLACMKNYREMKNVFNPTEDERNGFNLFNQWIGVEQ